MTEPREIPILYSGPMIRALLENRKTQTRRLIKPGPPAFVEAVKVLTDEAVLYWKPVGDVWRRGGKPCPYGKPGDLHWARETWAQATVGRGNRIAYRADGQHGCWGGDGSGRLSFFPHGWVLGAASNDREGCWKGIGAFGGKWRPSIHMPKWACRIWLRVVKVRAERLQDISESDIRAEGCPDEFWIHPFDWWIPLWDEINGKRAPWASNPFVWVIEFERYDR